MLIALSNPFHPETCLNSQISSADDSLKTIEKVYLHVDRDTYYPGDDIWFKAYLTDASYHLLSEHSSNLHIELISPLQKIVDSRIIKLNGGLGKGDFHLSENLKTGRYLLRVYTNWMRNWGDELFFTRDVVIINSSDSAKAFSESQAAISRQPEISFFPEGGSLVDNVPSVVAFKAVNGNGFAYNVSGNIYSSSGEKITGFKSAHKGMGTFLLEPVHGSGYFAMIRNQTGDSVRYELPESFPKGLVLSVSNKMDSTLLLMFQTNPGTLRMIRNRDLSLTISEHNVVLKTYSFKIRSLNNFFHLPTSDLPDGIVRVTLSGMEGIPLCERLVLIQNHKNVRIRIQSDNTVYNKRDSVSVAITLSDSSGVAKEAFLSLSATDDIFTDNSSGFPSTISSWFLLESEVRGPVEEPSYYFDESNPDRLKDLDLLLLTQGWRDFQWKYQNAFYPPEYGFTISGRVRNRFADVPVKKSVVNIGIFTTGKPFIGFVPTDSSGRFNLTGVDLSGEARLIASVTNDKDNLRGWLLLDSAKYNPAKVEKIMTPRKNFPMSDQGGDDSLATTKNFHRYIQYVEFRNDFRKKYKLSDTIPLGEIKVTATRIDWTETAYSRSRHYLQGTPDHEYVIDPVTEAYTNVSQFVKSRIMPLPLSPHEMKNPLYLLDGVKVPESTVKNLPLKWVERIDVIDDLASNAGLRTVIAVNDTTMGYSDGTISIILRSGYNAEEPVFHSVNIKISGYNEPRVFYSPKHHTKLESDYKPDLRTTLFWAPDIIVENNKKAVLSYFNADNSSRIKLVVEGITSTGIPVTCKSEYEVK